MIGFIDRDEPPLPPAATSCTLPGVPAKVTVTPEANAQHAALPLPIQARVAAVIGRLRSWPNVSGEKALTGDHRGSFRIRTGDYRVVYRVENPRAKEPKVVIWKIGDRRDVYDD